MNKLGLTCKTRNTSHEIEITPWKTNQNKLQNSIFNHSNIKGWNNKNQLKNNKKNYSQPGLTC
jgi:hypothetical protein